jgi:hypothetical protein
VKLGKDDYVYVAACAERALSAVFASPRLGLSLVSVTLNDAQKFVEARKN